MRQLLESINGINMARGEGQRHFESHIFFDGAVKDRNPTDFVLQLVALVESTLGTSYNLLNVCRNEINLYQGYAMISSRKRSARGLTQN